MAPSDPKSRLTLIRHGQSTWNGARLVQGHNDDAVLTDLGRQQAMDAVSALRPLGIDTIISSDLTRASETARIIANGLGLGFETAKELRERSYGAAEGHPFEELTPLMSGIEDGLVVDARARPFRGESLDDLYRRVGTFIDDVQRRSPDESLLIVTHGGTIRAIRAFCEGRSMSGLVWDPVTNCSIWPV